MTGLRLFLLSAALWVSSQNTQAADIFRLWHGVGIQGTQGDWSSEIDLTRLLPTVAYPSLKCGGTWEPLGVQNGVYEFRELITYGRDVCIDGYVRVYLLNKKRMAIEYYQFRNETQIAAAVVFPGPHHEDLTNFMIDVTRKFIAASAR
jgi:hypothetical protein